MAKFNEYDEVVLKNGDTGTIVNDCGADADGKQTYIVDFGDGSETNPFRHDFVTESEIAGLI